jgi:osmotically-inducible protein OsmY
MLALAVAVSCSLLNTASLLASVVDDRIQSSAKQTYVFKTYLKADKINVKSTGGEVTLTGTVAEMSHKSLAQDTVASLPGVKSVDNQLTLKSEGPATGSDAWLSTKVKFVLLFHKNVNATGTKVTASNGAVTLRGKAASSAQKELTTKYANDVEGVTSVANEMTVSITLLKKNMNPRGKRSDALSETIDDASITALVKATLFSHRSTSALNTEVETKNGFVTLTGKANNAAEKDLAEKLVSDVRGVKTVVNHITVG